MRMNAYVTELSIVRTMAMAKDVVVIVAWTVAVAIVVIIRLL